MKTEAVFETAVSAVGKIINQGGFVNIVVDETLSSRNLDDSERRLFTRLVYGTVENKILIDYYLCRFIKGKRLKPDLKNTLRVASYALEFLDLADHFIVNTAVEAVKHKDFKGSRLINGVLRQYLDSPRPDLTKLPYKEYLSIKYSYPPFLIDLIASQYPDDIERIIGVTGEKSSKALRINTLKSSENEVLKSLAESNIAYEMIDGALFTEENLIHHPLFQRGAVTYQDLSSQLVSQVVDPKPGEKILDACSAPGGKTAHMAALANNQDDIVACDVYEHKLKLMEENFERLGVTCVKLIIDDARNLSNHFAKETFDKLLLDAPCSGLGVMGHKADIKYQLDREKLDRLEQLQFEILDAIEPLLKNGGNLVYSTCTINQEENQLQMQDFLKRHPQYHMVFEETILPDRYRDGFYICKLNKTEGKR
jgi:16S rRNA (cytosine967-C5)-methyltransferase